MPGPPLKGEIAWVVADTALWVYKNPGHPPPPPPGAGAVLDMVSLGLGLPQADLGGVPPLGGGPPVLSDLVSHELQVIEDALLGTELLIEAGGISSDLLALLVVFSTPLTTS